MSGLNYAKGMAVGNNNIPFFNSPPPVKAIRQTFSENATVSSVITLSESTTAVEITAGGAPVAIRWVSVADASTAATSVITTAGSGTGSNYDHVTASNSRVRFVIPIDTGPTGVAGNASAVGANIENGLFRRLAYKTQGISSVFIAEYGSSNTA